MDHETSEVKEVARIIKRLGSEQISCEFAKAQLHYMMETARTAEELETAYAAYEQVRIAHRPGDI